MPDGVASPPPTPAPTTRTPPPPPNAAPIGGSGQTGVSAWVKQHKFATVGIAVAGAFAVFLFARWRSAQSGSSASSTSGTSADTTPSVYQLAPGAYEGWNGTTGQDSGGLSQSLAQIEQSLSGIQTSLNQGIGKTPTPNQGYGQTTINGVLYDILGIESGKGPQSYSGYNVSGGAPVFYYSQGSKTPMQGSGEAVPGAQVLVPSIYGPQISSSPTHTYHG